MAEQRANDARYMSDANDVEDFRHLVYVKAYDDCVAWKNSHSH